jgi:hypothetical protein
VPSVGGMVRRVVGVGVGLVVIGAVGIALGDGDETIHSYSSTQALGRDIDAYEWQLAGKSGGRRLVTFRGWLVPTGL